MPLRIWRDELTQLKPWSRYFNSSNYDGFIFLLILIPGDVAASAAVPASAVIRTDGRAITTSTARCRFDAEVGFYFYLIFQQFN